MPTKSEEKEKKEKCCCGKPGNYREHVKGSGTCIYAPVGAGGKTCNDTATGAVALNDCDTSKAEKPSQTAPTSISVSADVKLLHDREGLRSLVKMGIVRKEDLLSIADELAKSIFWTAKYIDERARIMAMNTKEEWKTRPKTTKDKFYRDVGKETDEILEAIKETRRE